MSFTYNEMKKIEINTTQSSNGSKIQLQRTIKRIALADILPYPVMVKNVLKIIKQENKTL